MECIEKMSLFLVGEQPRYLYIFCDLFILDRIQLSLFGSSVNGFGSRSSDLDICMTFQDMTDPDRINYAGWIDRLAKHLVSHPELTKILAIRTAKVPIVKFYHKAFKLEGDISLYNTLALRNTKLLKTYANMDSRVQILGYTVKIFAKVRIYISNRLSRWMYEKIGFDLVVEFYFPHLISQPHPPKNELILQCLSFWNLYNTARTCN